MKKTVKGLLLLAVVAFTGCLDKSEKAAPEKTVEVPEVTYHLKCWSEGVVIYDGYSTESIKSRSGPIFRIRDKADGKRKAMSGDCVAEIYS